MRNDRHLAIQLRRKGKSYNRISQDLGIPKSTMCYWFRDLKWSKIIKQDLTEKAKIQSAKRLRMIIRTKKKRWEEWRKQHRENAKEEFPILKSNPLFIAGLMLYWGEGDSKIENSLVRLSNTDPKMIKIVALFLEDICKIPKEKIKATLILYPDLDDNKCKNFWIKATGISRDRFYKTQFIYGRHPTKRLLYGICNIYVASRGLKEKILVWIKLYKEELTRA